MSLQEILELCSKEELWKRNHKNVVALIDAKTQIKELQDQLALTHIALELACEELGKVEVFDAEFMECDSFCDYFKTKAKEMMKSE